jgi:uncharacterized protein YbaP (TraB family)
MLRSSTLIQAIALAAVAASAPSPVMGDERLEQRHLATDRYPGPALWRVTKGDHELLLFGTLSAVTGDMRWSSAAVERAVARSQEVLSPPGVRATPSLKPVHLVKLWRRVRELSANPGDKRLAQVVPADLYRRYAALRDRYARRDRSIETQRPIVAGGRIYEGAVDALGLESKRDIDAQIERAARRAGIEITDTKLHADPDTLLDYAARVTVPAELDCFAKVLDDIEGAERTLVARARAWARGDLTALLKAEYPDIRRECLAHPGWPEQFTHVLDEADALWLTAAERALASRRTTFATLDIRELIVADGLLARLRARGYDVHEPAALEP